MSRVMELAIAIKGRLDGSVASSMQRAIAESKELKTQIKAANDAMRSAQRAASAEQRATGQVSVASYRQIAALQARINDLTQRRSDILDAQARKQKAQAAFDSAKSNLAGTAMKTAVLAAPLVGATKAAMEFESEMAEIRKVVDFDTPEQFKQMGQDILDLSTKMPMAASGIAKIVAAGGQAGIAKEDLLEFAQDAVKMGVAFDLTADQAGDMMAKWRSAFKLNQQDVMALADKINYLGNTTAASAPLISDVVTRIGPLGEIGGLASGEIAALGASMIETGTQSDVAATGIKNLILGMAAGEGATKSQAAAFQQLGFDAVDMAKRMRTDAKGAIMDVFRAIQSLPEYQQAGVLSDLFGKESIEAIAPLLTNLDKLQSKFEAVNDATKYGGAVDSEYAARCETTANQMYLFKNSMTAVAIEIGSALLPAINSILRSIVPVVVAFANWAKEHQVLIQTIVALAASFAGVLLAARSILAIRAGFRMLKETADMFFTVNKNGETVLRGSATASKLFHAGLNGLGAAFRAAATGARALAMALMANPIIAIVAVIIAVVAAIIYFWNTNEQFRAAVIAIWNNIVSFGMSLFSALAAFFTGVWNGLVTIATAVWSGIMTVATMAVSVIMDIISAFGAFFTGVWNGLVTIATAVWSGMMTVATMAVSVIMDIISAFGAFFTGVWNGLVTIATAVWSGMMTVATMAVSVIMDIISAFGAFFTGVWNGLVTIATAVWSGMMTVATMAVSVIMDIISAFGAFFTGVWNGLVTIATAVWSGMMTVATMAVSVIMDIISAFGAFFTGVWNGLVTIATAVWSGMMTVATMAVSVIMDIISAFGAFFTGVWNGLVTIATAVWSGMMTVATMAVSVIMDIISAFGAFFTGVWNGLVTIATAVWNGMMTVATMAVSVIMGIISAFGAFFAGVWNGLVTIATAVWSGMMTVATMTVSVIIGIISAFGAFFAGVWNGCLAIASAVWDAISSFVSAAASVIEGIISALVDYISGAWDSAVAAVQSFASSVIDAIGQAVDWAMDKWSSLVNALSHPIDTAINIAQNITRTISEATSGGDDVSENARGGIYQRGAFLTTFAEDSAEAAIPLDGSARAISLWQQAGTALGVMPKTPQRMSAGTAKAPSYSNSSITLNFRPTINVQGGGDVADVVRQALEEQARQFQRELPKMLDRVSAGRRRLSYE